jgi:peroxiredoxin
MSLIEVGSACPAFKVEDHDGTQISSDKLLADNTTFVLYFYPKGKQGLSR